MQGEQTQFYSLDRIEGNIAVLLQGEVEHLVPRAALPATAKEGQLFNKDVQGVYTFAKEETKQAQDQVRTRLSALLKRK